MATSALLLFPFLGAVTGLFIARLAGPGRGLHPCEPLWDVTGGALGAFFTGAEATLLAGGWSRPGLLAATVAGLGGAVLLVGVLRTVQDRLALEP